MAEQLMEATWRTALWRQFGASIDMLENALLVCPDSLWKERLWNAPADRALPSWLLPEFSEFWLLTYHALFWLDLYLSGSLEEDFSPPAPFIWTEIDPAVLPEQPYTKEELHAYLKATRRKCYTTFFALTDERALQNVSYSWAQGQPVSFFELQLYSMRHIQEHVAQLSLFLGQHGIPDEALDWVPRAKEDADSY